MSIFLRKKKIKESDSFCRTKAYKEKMKGLSTNEYV